MKRELTKFIFLSLSGSLFSLTCQSQTKENVLVIVVDDLGKEMLSIYDTPTKIKANTPNIDKLASRGVVFDKVWGSPLSAPVRSAMITGRYGHHTGIVALDITLPISETTIFEALPNEYSNAVIGKWHLSQDLDFAPDYGIDHFAGFATNGGVRDYYNWRYTEDGVSTITNEYATTKITNSAKEWISKQTSPWVCWVAYNAPHIPLHLPPKEMHSQKNLSGSAEDIEKNPMSYFLAMIESLDYDIGRLLESVDESTKIILIGDNGTEKRLLQSPYSPRHGKGSLYDSGVTIPMIVLGGDIEPTSKRSDALVSAVDIFPTIMELTGEKMASYEDGYSFASVTTGGETLRKYNFSEILNPRQGYMNAISDGRYKLITYKNGTEEFYDTVKDPLESKNLTDTKLSAEEKNIREELREEIEEMNIPLDSIPEKIEKSNSAGAQYYNRGFGGNRQNSSGNNNRNNNQYRNNR